MIHKLSKENHIFSFSKDYKTALFVKDGDEIEIETLDCFSNQIQTNEDKLEQMDWNKVNPATGPIYVEGAKEGDVLEVTIKNIEIADKGVVATGKDLGVLGDLMDGLYSRVVNIKDGKIIFDEKISIPIKPMIGVIGVSPREGNINCGTPGSHGGNMDTSLIGEGSKLYLPVFVEGALLALGDLHAVMGDGEVGVSGVEAAGSVTVEVRVVKNLKLVNPLVKTPEVTATIASDESLDKAVKIAVHDMANLFQSFTKLSIEEIATLFSIAGNVQISQVVDPLKTARFSLPNWVLDSYNIVF
ncbi:amidase [Thermoanaerobacter thermohydrosulfuricus]|uniref:Amidase n=2 Tax=Thermoanaerobacter thermohydrosulfuricus TaxID=1516 RepID=A0A1G7Q494_THETY|nr:acetamidase/formamidase family protein [Thermoanaerobacter thermohydrosulfuricus]EMT38244.1 putative acetamidase/formamidase [Thermoanaerobacter thermohydrosulfuricus WC1]SDF93285.1 amidase [Thermoanaerobacter thermohydrosulfuricus]